MEADQEKRSKTILINKRVATTFFLLSGLSIMVMLFSTTPSEVGPEGVTAFFLLLYVFSLSALEIIYRVAIGKKRFWPYWLKATYALAPVAFIALSSLRQLTTVDVAMGVILLAAVSVYHNRNS